MYSSGTGSLAVWARSADFNTKINIAAPNGVIVGTDDSNGWNQPGDIDNAAVNVQLTQVGEYEVQISASGGNYGNGNFKAYINPGCDFLQMYSGHDPQYVFGISSSNYVCICDNGGQIAFFNIGTGTVEKAYRNGTGSYTGVVQSYGACYSKQQDRVFAWIYDGGISNDAIIEFDNTGSFVAVHSLAAYVIGYGVTCYDQVNDRFFLLRTGMTSQYNGARFIVWDCATRTVVDNEVKFLTITPGSTAYCTYADVNNRYYVSFHNLTNNCAMTWIDASSLANSGSTNQGTHDFIQYISESKVIGATRNNSGGNDYRGFCFFDPVTDTLKYTSPMLWYFEGGTNFDPCQNVITVGIDNGGGTSNANGLLCFDGQYNVVNFIPVQNTGYGQYLYGIGYVATSSRLYIGTMDYNSSNSLYSCKISCPTGSATFNPVYTDQINLTLSSGSTIMNWTFYRNDNDGFILERSASGDPDYVWYQNFGKATRTYTDYNVTGSPTDVVAYHYRMASFSGSVTGSYASASITFKAPGPELVTNGGFETGDFTGWTQTNASYTSIKAAPNPTRVHTGNYGLEKGDYPTEGFISQVLTTGAGNSYTYKLWIYGDSGTTVHIYWEGSVIATISDPAQAWTLYNYSVTATGPTSEIKIGVQDNNAYIGIDDISVS